MEVCIALAVSVLRARHQWASTVCQRQRRLDEYVAQHWPRSRRKHHGRVSCGSASPCTMDFCENMKQRSEMQIRQVAANSETIILASTTRAQVTRTPCSHGLAARPGQRVALGSLPLMPRVSWTSNQIRRGDGCRSVWQRWWVLEDVPPHERAAVKLRFDLTHHWVFHLSLTLT